MRLVLNIAQWRAMYAHEGPVLSVCWSKVRVILSQVPAIRFEVVVGWYESFVGRCGQGRPDV